MMNNSIRVRFAPSPTGLLHLGSVRTALFNYLYAHKNVGTFILRIEDTDAERNFDPGARIILDDLAWLGLTYDEGPTIEGPCSPYFQSQRDPIYAEKLSFLITNDKVYRCFCTEEELEKKRLRQINLKQPPRYDRTCLALMPEQIDQLLQRKTPFIWRFKLNTQETIQVNDLARGSVNFDLSHFSDFALTRNNGSFTFLFANAVDDITMHITHIFRGEDHISNTPCQIALYNAFNFKTPLFWHMPIICNVDGKKLSKRDFGFSLKDLREGGFLPEAICNYLAIIGGSYKNEILTLTELINEISFDTLSATTGIKYDLEKLLWVNHQWILKSSIDHIATLAYPFLQQAYPAIKDLSKEQYLKLITLIKPEIKTLKDCVDALSFYFNFQPNQVIIRDKSHPAYEIISFIQKQLDSQVPSTEIASNIKQLASTYSLGQAHFWKLVRSILTGHEQGVSVKDLFNTLSSQEITQRLAQYT